MPSSNSPKTLPPQGRRTRAGEVLDLVRRGEAATTSELASVMGVARSTVTDRVDLLESLGLLVSTGTAEASGRGRPANTLAFNGAAGVVFSSQVGMTGTQVAITDLSGTVLDNHRVQLDLRLGPDALFEMLERECRDLLRKYRKKGKPRLFGIAVGLPGAVELATAGRTTNSGDKPWTTNGHADRLRDAFDCDVYVDQDVNLMAIGEHRTCFPDAQIFLCLKVGTVIASGLLVDGKPVTGANGLAGEIGHTKVAGSEAPCACGKRGCLNAVAGAGALAEALAAQGHETTEAKDVMLLAREGVVAAAQAIREAGRQIGEVVAAAINLINPDAITLWGYLDDAGDHLVAGMRETIYASAISGATQGLVLTSARTGDDAGVLGGAMRVIEQQLLPDAVDALVSAGDASDR